MARTICRILPCVFLLVAAHLNAQTAPPPTPVEITLGHAAAPLCGPWKFTIGDSPIDSMTGKLLWTEPDFDDSSWETVDLTSRNVATDSASRYVPGWTARGHAEYWGWAWYRLRVRVAANPGDEMAIDGPAWADDAWQLFAGGQLVGSFGEFDRSGNVRRIYFPRPSMFPLLSIQRSESGAVSETLAFRVWMGPGSLANAGLLGNSPQPGGLHYPPMLVAGSAVTAQSRLDWQEWLIGRVDEVVYIALFLLLAVLSASLILFDRSDRVYLWVAATMLVSPAGYILVNVCATTTWLDGRLTNILINTDDALQAAGWVMVWWVWFHFRRPTWVPRAIFALTVCLAAADSLKWGLSDYGIALRHGRNAAIWDGLAAIDLTCRFLFVLALALIVIAGIRQKGREGWFALPVVAALAVEISADVFGVEIVGRFHGMEVRIWDLTDPFLVAVLAVLMLRRLLHSLERQRQMALDVKQAQEVQQVILPEARTVLPGLVIESEYRPAREVGGDFFQIIPNDADKSLLIVAGDVTGKGLKAGMLVALLVGALRSSADECDDPTYILRALNRRLVGRADAQATCLALRISKDGCVDLANAGHIAPFLNRVPLPMEGALPLGMIQEIEPSTMQFQLHRDDRLVLISDGIPEATNAEGELFGFERLQNLLSAFSNATEVATAAQAFGQEDDISVISVTRIGVAEPALAQPRFEK